MEGASVKELVVDNFYRVLVVEFGDSALVSVDVYAKGFNFKIDEKVCVEAGYCLVYGNADLGGLPSNLSGRVERAVIVGIQSPAGEEVVNVRWFIRGNVDEALAKALFCESWKLVSPSFACSSF